MLHTDSPPQGVHHEAKASTQQCRLKFWMHNLEAAGQDLAHGFKLAFSRGIDLEDESPGKRLPAVGNVASARRVRCDHVARSGGLSEHYDTGTNGIGLKRKQRAVHVRAIR